MKPLLENRRSHLSFVILDTYDAGVFLLGIEVKSLKNRRGSLEGAFIVESGGELYIRKLFIPPYQERNTPGNYDPYRDRKLYLRKNETLKIINEIHNKGVAVIPLGIYETNNHRVLIRIAITKHANKHDKRQKEKTRDTSRALRAEFGNSVRV